MSRRAALVAVVALALAGGGSCATARKLASGQVDAATLADAAQTGAKVFKAIGSLTESVRPEQEYYVGRSVATNILARHQYSYRDREAIAAGRLEGLTAYVNHVGALIAAAALETTRKGDRPAPIAGWRFVVVDSDQINAFAAPGGFVFVTTAAVKTARSEDELAALLAHEVAHVVRGHALGNIKRARYANVSQDVLAAAGRETLTPEQQAQLTDLMEGMIEDMIDAYFVKGYSRDTELEADRLGLELTAAAGYDPDAMVRFLDRLARRQDTGHGGFYETHPKASDRIARLRAALKGRAPTSVPSKRTERFLAAVESLGT